MNLSRTQTHTDIHTHTHTHTHTHIHTHTQTQYPIIQCPTRAPRAQGNLMLPAPRGLSVKRDLVSFKRDLISVERDLISDTAGCTVCVQ
jgi:hypothetical protein